jgi:hypothetical protein
MPKTFRKWEPGQILKLTFVHSGAAGAVEQVVEVLLIGFDELRDHIPRDE